MVDIHGLVSNRSSLDQNVLGIKMSYANLPASMGKPRADLEWTLPRAILVSDGSGWPD